MSKEPFTDFFTGETCMLDDPFPAGMMPDIEQFLSKVHPTLKPGRDLYPEIFDTAYFFPLQRQREMEAMIKVARRVESRVVAELGCDKSGGLYHWCMSLHPTIECVIGVEIRGTPWRDAFAQAFPKLEFLTPQGGSRDSSVLNAIRLNLMKMDRKIDVLFIDGEKLGFLKDFDAYLPLMNPNGIVFLHDITDTYAGGPGEVFAKIKRRGYATDSIIDTSDSMAAMEREKAGIPPTGAHEAWLRHWRGTSCGVGVVHLGSK